MNRATPKRRSQSSARNRATPGGRTERPLSQGALGGSKAVRSFPRRRVTGRVRSARVRDSASQATRLRARRRRAWSPRTARGRPTRAARGGARCAPAALANACCPSTPRPLLPLPRSSGRQRRCATAGRLSGTRSSRRRRGTRAFSNRRDSDSAPPCPLPQTRKEV